MQINQSTTKFSLNRSTLRIIGFVTMILDHVGAVFLKSSLYFRLPGRLCYPIFAYFLVSGFQKTKNPQRYLGRILLCALAAQYPYGWIVHFKSLNSVFALALGLIGLDLFRRAKLPLAHEALIWSLLAATAVTFKIDYGAYGILLIGFVSHFKNNRYWWSAWILFHAALVPLHAATWHQSLAVITPILWINIKEDHRPSRFGYWLYPIHLWIIFLIAKFALRLH